MSVSVTINHDDLRLACTTPISELRKLGKFVLCDEETDSGYTYIDNGSKILGVAHTDSVQSIGHFYRHKTSDHGHVVLTPTLDDRIGVYTLLFMLPQLGINVDVLLTEDEEMGRSTASFFTTEKKYNWVVEFDRGGTDAVLYQYQSNDKLVRALRKYYTIGAGSYSDIADLTDLGCSGMNLATGYYQYHSFNAYLVEDHYKESIRQFAKFYRKYHRTHFDHVPSPYRRGRLSYYSSYGWNDENLWYGGKDQNGNPYYGPDSKGYLYLPETTSISNYGELCPICEEFFRDDDNLYSIWQDGGCMKCTADWHGGSYAGRYCPVCDHIWYSDENLKSIENTGKCVECNRIERLMNRNV